MPYENMLNILARGIQTKPTWDYMDSRMNALKSLGMEQDIQMQPQRLAMEQERLGLAREQLGVSKGNLGINQGQFELEKQRFAEGREDKEAAKLDRFYKELNEYPDSFDLKTWNKKRSKIPEKYREEIPSAEQWMESMGQSGMLTPETDPNEVFKKQILPRYIGKTQQMKERKLQADEMEAQAKIITATREGNVKPEAPYSDVGKAEADRQRYLKGGYPVDHPVILALDKKISGEKEEKDKVPAQMEDFEKTIYGKLVPEKRGTVEYKADRLKWINDQKEQSPYTKAFEKQNANRQREYGTNLRKEFNALPETKSFLIMREKSDAMASALDESKTSKNFIGVDQVLITLFNKMSDPESVVRESEYARTVENMPFLNRFQGAFEKVKKGGAGLTQDDRESLVKMAGRLRQVSEKKYNERYYEFRSYLEKNDLNPDEFLPARAKKVGTEAISEKEARRRLKEMGKGDDEIQGYINKYRQEGVVK